MLVSRNSMKAANVTTRAISQGLTAGRQGWGGEGGVAPFPPELSVCESIEGSALLVRGASVQPTLVDGGSSDGVVWYEVGTNPRVYHGATDGRGHDECRHPRRRLRR